MRRSYNTYLFLIQFIASIVLLNRSVLNLCAEDRVDTSVNYATNGDF